MTREREIKKVELVTKGKAFGNSCHIIIPSDFLDKQLKITIEVIDG